MSVSETPPGDPHAGPAEVTVGRLATTVTETVEPDAHVASATYLMKRAGASALLVTTDPAQLPIAVITDADVSQAGADGRDLNETRIHQLHLPRPVTVSADTPVTDAAEQMLKMSLQHLTVVDDGRLVGLVDIAAVCRALLQLGRPT